MMEDESMEKVTKMKPADMSNVEMIDLLDELRGRLHLLSHATTGLLSSGITPSDDTVNGINYAFDDCCKIVNRVIAYKF